MPPAAPHQAFRNLLHILAEAQEQEWRKEEDKVSAYAILRNKVSQCLTSFLDVNVSSRGDALNLVGEHRLILLPPLLKDRHLVPYLTLYYDGEGTIDSCCRLYVLLLGYNRNQNGRNEVHGIGFRIESPERNCQVDGQHQQDIGMHDFYHAQFILNMNRDRWPNFYRTFPCLPDSQPSFPLWATHPFDALLNLILTLYGAKYYLYFLRKYGSKISGAMSDEFKLLNQRLIRNP